MAESGVVAGSMGVLFEFELPAGKTELRTWVYDGKEKVGDGYFSEVAMLLEWLVRQGKIILVVCPGMNGVLNRLLATLIGGLLLLGVVSSDAAKAPVAAADLEKRASLIVVGTVVDVKSKTEKSKIETGFGIHRDTIFRIKLKVGAVLKGRGVKVGDEIEVVAWKPSKRIPPLAGLQGHDPIPAKGDRVKVYVEGKDGKAFRPILPNGMVVEETGE